jgi:hypothetical protein
VTDRVLPTPDPVVGDEESEFWRALADGRFLLRRCGQCGNVPWYPRPFCPACGSRDVPWFEASGTGTVYSYTIAAKAGPPFDAAVPYVIAYVELDEGPRIISNVVGCPPEQVHIGQRVEVCYVPRSDGPALYRFAPTEAAR